MDFATTTENSTRYYSYYQKVIIVLIGILIFLIGWLRLGLEINTTPSMPVGLYQKIKGIPKRGDIVLACVPMPLATFSKQRGYLNSSSQCNGTTPIIKQVIAIPGDKVILNSHNIIANNNSYPCITQHYDSQHRPLPALPRGIYIATGYWLIGTHDVRSWDSRYWGDLPRKQIIARLRSLLVFK